jgi:cyclopropane fatty-acyl-phospholipid synthase-like methyltransferase
MQSNWEQIWNARRINKLTLKDTEEILHALICMDGFDSSLSAISPKDWRMYTSSIMNQAKMEKGDSVFEIGCGAGAFLYSLFLEGYEVAGIDYSNNMISEGKKYLSNMDISVCDAALCSTNEQYDAVLSNSAFSYFPDHNYANIVMERMFLKAKKVVLILDIPNWHCKKMNEHVREEKIENYKDLYRGNKHLYFEKEWFLNFANAKNCEIEITDQNIKNYGNNPFRFNCVIWKNL